MGWLIAVGILVGIMLLPVGIRAVYNSFGAFAWLTIGFVCIPLYPTNKRETSNSPKSKQVKTSQKTKEKAPGQLSDFRTLLDIILSLLTELRKRIYVKDLVMKLTVAGDDPADVAIYYGQAWSLLGGLVPQLDNFFRIKKRNLSVNCDFTVNEPMFYGCIHICLPLGRLLYISIFHGYKGFNQLQRIKKLRKGGTKL